MRDRLRKLACGTRLWPVGPRNAANATSNVLWFVAGGVALADFDYTERVRGITTGSVFTGCTLGGGADIAINPSWIARVEYLHDDFGDKTFLINGDPYRVKLTGDTVHGALMYKF
jgi:outer membrane immunogenic protein